MKMAGAGVCPLVRIGDIVKGRTVVDIVCDRHVGATCSAHNTLAMLRIHAPEEQRQVHFIAPPNVVNCDECPVLARDPDHRSKTKSQQDLINEAAQRGDHYLNPIDPSIGLISKPEHEPKKSKPVTRGRFELIDISEKEEQDEESSSDPNES